MVRFRVGFCTYTHDSPLPVTDELLAENASEFSRKWTGDARRQRRRTRNGRKLCTKCAKKSKVIVLCRWPPAESFEEDRDGKESASEQNELSSDEKIPDSKDDEQSTANNKSARENNEPPRMQSQPWGTTNTFSYRRLVASGYINGKSLDAVADSGASFSVISQELAGTLGLHTDMASAVSVCLPSGRMIRTLGKTAGVFRFSGEEESYTLLCIVLEKCAHPLVLGSQFLRATHTLTKYTNRVKNVFSNILGLNFMGVLEAEQHLLHGYLNGQSVDVVPDTGSDIMAMSLQFALQLDLTIYVGHQNRTTVQFIDGSEAWTIGMVRGVKWDFLDSWRYALDREEYEFHVIQHLPVDVIVNNDFIQKFKVFKRHKHVLVLRRPKEFQPGIYGIRFINSLHGHKKEQSTSVQFSSADMEESELHRRDAAEEDIEELLPNDPVAAESKWLAEQERRRAQIERKRRYDEAQLASMPQTATTNTGGVMLPSQPSTTGSSLHNTNIAQQSADALDRPQAGLAPDMNFDAESGQPRVKRRRFKSFLMAQWSH